MARALQLAAEQAADHLVSAPQAAELPGIAEQTLAVWRSTGRYGIPFVKVGRRVLYPASALEEFIQANTRTQTD